MKRKKSMFITFEGIDGCGKSTQLKLTSNYLKKLGYKPEILREPGSTILSEKIRKILLNKDLKINPISELMLYVAARAELVDSTIGPALDDGKIILCDRFYDSTTAYQGFGRGLDTKVIDKMNRLAVGKYKPD
ncbi:MAG: dTMP kinase, partial [candidate division Zixibacteria bacterium]|nr:dTMP kinase [candidate division Zixibacteria bacterium]